MAKCRNCGHDISSALDRDICPHCGEKSPVEKGYETMDLTGNIATLEGDYELYKSKRRLYAFLFGLFLGMFGADLHYRGFHLKGFLVMLFNVVFIGMVGTILLFATSMGMWIWGYLIPLFVVFGLFAIWSLRYLLHDTWKDSRGEFMR